MKDPADKNEDLAVFRAAVGDVMPLNHADRSQSRAPRPKPYPMQLEKDEEAVKTELLDEPEDFAELETGEELLFLRPGIQKRYLTRLRRGRYSIADHLDLHHMNEATASKVLLEFIEASAINGFGCVRVIHGKGLRSKNGPKLKAMTRRLLSRNPLVIAFASCRPIDGGTGAVSVLLKGHKPR